MRLMRLPAPAKTTLDLTPTCLQSRCPLNHSAVALAMDAFWELHAPAAATALQGIGLVQPVELVFVPIVGSVAALFYTQA